MCCRVRARVIIVLKVRSKSVYVSNCIWNMYVLQIICVLGGWKFERSYMKIFKKSIKILLYIHPYVNVEKLLKIYSLKIYL